MEGSAEVAAPLFLSIGVLLFFAWSFGEIARRLNQPAVLGEIIAGLVLGPTVFGYISPDMLHWMFPAEGHTASMIEGITSVSIALFLLVAGMEVEFAAIIKARRIAAITGIGGLIVPFIAGFGAAYMFPEQFGAAVGHYDTIFALFIATAMSISALPVIARTLMDLNLYRSELGMITIAAAVLNDLIGWLVFAVILALFGIGHTGASGIVATLVMTILFSAAMLTIGRKIIDKALTWVQAYLSWPAGTLGFVLVVTFFSAAAAEVIGIHAIFGSFLAGVALGDSKHLSEHTRKTITQLVSFVFAPLFFASIGLKVNITANFDFVLTMIIIAIAFAGKIFGSGITAKLSGLSNRESIAIGVALNARGAMEIILALLALQMGVIDEKLFVSLLVMALATSLFCGPVIKRVLQLKPGRRFVSYLSDKYFISNVSARTPIEVIEELSVLFRRTGLDVNVIKETLIEREKLMPTGLSNGVAVPHARVKGLKHPVIAVGISRGGINFDSSDGTFAQVIIVILVPESENALLLNLFAEIAKTFNQPDASSVLVDSKNFAQFLSSLRVLIENVRR
ncbi:MAG: cation:proton antiporter [Deferribacterales bacterium]